MGSSVSLRRRWGATAWLGCALLVTGGLAATSSGCVGDIGDTAGDGSDGDGCVGCDPETQAAASIVTTRFPRLSHLQWENTVRDLFYLSAPTGLSANFVNDPLAGAFDNNERSLYVTPTHWQDYQTAAEEIALMAVTDPAVLAAITPASLPSDPTEAARTFVRTFGERAYRRPLTDEEVETYVALFLQANELYIAGSAFERGVQHTIIAFLQSPHFLYRTQLGSEAVDGLIPLTGHEIATKLSYMLWNTMPDPELFEAASSGELDTTEGTMTQAARMLDDPRARDMVHSFHEQLYEFEKFYDLHKNETQFPGFTPEMGEDFEREASMFIEEVVFGNEGGLRELLTSTTTYVNADLAAIYGLEGNFTDEFVEVQLDPSQRAGLLTQVGFLASHATSTVQHSIARGVFINHRVLCAELPPPPDVIPPPPEGQFDTNRDLVEAHSGKGTCGESCHGTFINPAGFAFENYDALGQYQTVENGFPIDATDTYNFSDLGAQSFDGGVEFSALLADSTMAHHCYSKFWLEFGYGRDVQEGDELTLEELQAISDAGSVKELVLALTQTKAFRSRAPEGAAETEEQ